MSNAMLKLNVVSHTCGTVLSSHAFVTVVHIRQLTLLLHVLLGYVTALCSVSGLLLLIIFCVHFLFVVFMSVCRSVR